MDFIEKLRAIQEARKAAQAEWESILAAAQKENRDLNDEEKAKFAEHEAKVAALKADEERYQKIVDGRKSLPADAPISNEPKKASVVASQFRVGRLRAFRSEEDAHRSGQWFLAAVLGNDRARQWCGENGVELRALGTTSNPLGGALVIPEFERAIVDLREQYGVARQKCRVVPMGADTMTIPRRLSGVTAYFVNENTEITASDKTWDQVNLTARKLASLVKYSSEIAEDAIVSIADDLAMEIAYAFAVKEDACLFLGDGTSTYGGIVGLKSALAAGSKYTAITGNTAFSTLDLADFEAMVGQLPAYPGIQPEWYIHKAGWAASMMRLADAAGGATVSEITSGGARVPTFLGYPVNFCQGLNSTLTAQTSTTGLCYFGDLRMSTTLGNRRGITVKVSDHRYFEYDQFGIQATERFDIVNHEVGTASVAGPMLVLVTPGS